MPFITPEIKREEFVDREKELAIIEKAISDTGNLRIVNINGDGGIGKTSILREIKELYHEDTNLLVSEIIDFFDIATNTYRGFLNEVVRKLPEHCKRQFEDYEKSRDKADEIEHAGITGAILEEERAKASKSFQECYNKLADNKRIVLLIDTFEVVQDTLGEDIAKWLAGLNNTALIIAGRKNRDWQSVLTAAVGNKLKRGSPYLPDDIPPVAVGSKAVEYLKLEKFELDHTRELISLAEIGRTIGKEELQKLQILSEGLPILLILAVDREWPGGLPGAEYSQEEQTRTSEKYTLNELKTMPPNEIKKVCEDFRIELVTGVLQLRNMYPDARTILIMAQVYKYFTKEMLSHLTGKSVKETEKLLSEIVDWTFIKYDPRTESYWLHDLVRELVMNYIWPEIDPTGEERKGICKQAAKFYDQFFEDIEQEEETWHEKRKMAQMAGNRTMESTALRELLNLKRKRQHYQAQQIYYTIIADYGEGIMQYELSFVYNIWVGETYPNILLRQERDLALHEIAGIYSQHKEKLVEAKAKIVTEREYNEGIDLLETLLAKVKMQEEPYLYSDILLYQGIANTFKGEYELAEKKHEAAIEILEKLREKLTYPYDSNNLETRRIARSLSRSYGNMGYAFMNAGRLNEAIEAYKKALPYSKIGDIMSERAMQLNDLSFVYARLGDPERGRTYWKEGLEIRENLLFDYPIGLSYNTRGMIEYLADAPYVGKGYCEKALRIFRRIGYARGEGMSHRALGGILARIGQMESSEEILKQAEEHLLEAEKIFKKGGIVHEPIYLAETLERKGLMYNHLSNIAKAQGAGENVVNEYYEKAKDCFKKCIREFEREKSVLIQITAIGRLSRLYLEKGDLDNAQKELKKMEKILSVEIQPYSPLSVKKEKIPLNKIKRDFIYPLGTLEHRKARLNFEYYLNSKKITKAGDLSLLKASAIYYTWACAYLKLYSKESFATLDAFEEITWIIKQLSEQENEEFKNQVKASQEENDLEHYSEILERIEDAEIISGRQNK